MWRRFVYFVLLADHRGEIIIGGAAGPCGYWATAVWTGATVAQYSLDRGYNSPVQSGQGLHQPNPLWTLDSLIVFEYNTSHNNNQRDVKYYMKSRDIIYSEGIHYEGKGSLTHSLG